MEHIFLNTCLINLCHKNYEPCLAVNMDIEQASIHPSLITIIRDQSKKGLSNIVKSDHFAKMETDLVFAVHSTTTIRTVHNGCTSYPIHPLLHASSEQLQLRQENKCIHLHTF